MSARRFCDYAAAQGSVLTPERQRLQSRSRNLCWPERIPRSKCCSADSLPGRSRVKLYAPRERCGCGRPRYTNDKFGRQVELNMLFTTPPRTANDIRAFCARFNEGIRVEYKRNLDENVRQSMPKIVSSFANSLGGVLILGVNSQAGVPQAPIEGFEPAPREEIPLTLENIVIQNIYPSIFPRITEITSDVEGRRFVVIEIEDSEEAPHAIENSRTVYVRTGNAANPYELADVDSVIQLLRRRENPLRTRELLFQRAHVLGLNNATPQVQVSICPLMPKRALCAASDCWTFLRNTRYRGGHFFPLARLRRVQGGAAAFPDNECGEVNRYGFVLGRKHVSTAQRDAAQYLEFGDVFHLFVKTYWCSLGTQCS
jgi:hypothetical protein